MDARERIYRLFGKSGQGKRRQIVRAVFLFGGQRERGKEKLPHALGMQGKGYRLLPWGGPAEKNIGKDTKSGRNRAKTMICC